MLAQPTSGYPTFCNGYDISSGHSIGYLSNLGDGTDQAWYGGTSGTPTLWTTDDGVTSCETHALNDSDIAVGSYDDEAFVAPIDGSFTLLSFLGTGIDSWSTAVQDGTTTPDVVGMSRTSGDVFSAFVYTGGTLYDLNTVLGFTENANGWNYNVTEITGINASGDICGQLAVQNVSGSTVTFTYQAFWAKQAS